MQDHRIFVFGDSHRTFFINTHPGSFKPGHKDIITSYSLGPTTAHNFYNNHHIKVVDRLNSLCDRGCCVIVAGEIDCRLHIPKLFLSTHKPIKTLINDTVKNLMKSLIELQHKGFKPVAWGPHPTRNLETLSYNSEWYAGDQKLRNQICLAFNYVLYHESNKYNIPFGTNFYNIIKEYDNYTVYDEMYRDPIHLNQILWPTTRKLLGEINDNYPDF